MLVEEKKGRLPMYTELIDVIRLHHDEEDFYALVPKKVLDFQEALYDTLIPPLVTVVSSVTSTIDVQDASELKKQYEIFSKIVNLKKIKENSTNEYTNLMGNIDIGFQLYYISILKERLDKPWIELSLLRAEASDVIKSYMSTQKRINDFQRAWISIHQK